MAQLIFRPILAKGINPDTILAEVANVMRSTVAPEIAQVLEQKSNSDEWKNIKYDQVYGKTDRAISVHVFPIGDVDKWRWVSFGTPSHPIPKVPKQVGSLRFKWAGKGRHQPFTWSYSDISRLYGGTAPPRRLRTIPAVPIVRYFKQVNHPGIEPRHFEKQAKTEYEPRFRDVMRMAVKDGLAKAGP